MRRSGVSAAFVALALVLVAAVGLLASATSASGADGNSSSVELCRSADWSTLFRSADGTSFSNVGDCISYGAQGGTYAQLKFLPCFELPQGGVCWDVRAFGLQPGTLVTVYSDFLGSVTFYTALVGPSGTAAISSFYAACPPGPPLPYSLWATATTSMGAAITTPVITGLVVCAPA